MTRAIALTLLYSLYGLTLRRETFHHLNRAVLVCILLASAVLPLCHLRLGQSTWLSESFRRLEQQLPSFTEARLTEEAALLGVSSDGSQDFQSFHHDRTIIPSSSNDYSIMMEQSESLRGEGEISGLGASEEQGERGSWLVLALMAAYVLGAVLGLLSYLRSLVRVHKIHLNDSLNRHTASEEFSGNEKNGYVVQLQPEDREELGSRYHIRFMDEEHPVRSNPEVTGKATGRYDLRPANPAPVIERPAWPNYDVNNENSFAVFTDVNTVVGSGGRHLVSNSSYAKDALSSGSYTLYRCRDATYLACDYYDWQDWIFFCFSSKSALIDPDTGNRYRVRSLEHFPLDQCFWVHGQEGETLRFVGVFPPLPRNVKRVQLYIGTSKSRQWFNGSSELYEPVKVKDLRPSKTQQQARIIQ